MKVISFDVGIKNMAYCIFDISTNPIHIVEWKVVSLLGEETKSPLCNGHKKKKKKTDQEEVCGKLAKYTDKTNQIFLCDKHAKNLSHSLSPSLSKFLLPEPRFKNVKKMNIEELIVLGGELELNNLPKKKGELVETINRYLKDHVLLPISHKKMNAGEADMVSLGQAIKKVFSVVTREHPEIDVVLIENQISPIANRMKTIQGMLAQFFIMVFEEIRVEFVSSSNKLKLFSTKDKTQETEKTQGQIYKEHKKDGVFYCEQVIKEGRFIDGEKWAMCEKKKKDDLADCFLQGVWWLNKIKG
jgi:hypothetical protein